MAEGRKQPGIVITRARQGVLVQDQSGGHHWCRVPGKGRRLGMPVPGDRVCFDPASGTHDGLIVSIEPRRSYLERYSYGRRKDIAANMDRIILLATLREPAVSPRLVDRILVGASIAGMGCVIALNKTDLCEREEIERYLEPWRGVYPLLTLSAVSGEGLKELEHLLRGQTSMLAGASGVGKSTVLNALIKNLNLDTSAVSAATERGVHTTTATFLYLFPDGGTVADTPGIREFHPALDDVARLDRHFPEFEPHRHRCRFEHCLHLENITGCAVRQAVEQGSIHPARYQSFLLLRQSLLAGPRRGRMAEDAPPPF